MGLIEPVAVELINNWLSRPHAPGGTGMKGLWLLGLSAFLAIAGLVYLLIAFNTWLTALHGPLFAAFGTAVGAFILSGIAASAYSWKSRKPVMARATEDPLVETAETIIAALDALTAGLEKPVAENPRSSVAMASLAGYIAGEKFG